MLLGAFTHTMYRLVSLIYRVVRWLFSWRGGLVAAWVAAAQEYQPIVNKVFRIIDAQRDGSVPYQDVFYALAQLFPGKTSEKAELYFAMYDADGSGEMDKDEVCVILGALGVGTENVRGVTGTQNWHTPPISTHDAVTCFVFCVGCRRVAAAAHGAHES